MPRPLHSRHIAPMILHAPGIITSPWGNLQLPRGVVRQVSFTTNEVFASSWRTQQEYIGTGPSSFRHEYSSSSLLHTPI